MILLYIIFWSFYIILRIYNEFLDQRIGSAVMQMLRLGRSAPDNLTGEEWSQWSVRAVQIQDAKNQETRSSFN